MSIIVKPFVPIKWNDLTVTFPRAVTLYEWKEIKKYENL